MENRKILNNNNYIFFCYSLLGHEETNDCVYSRWPLTFSHPLVMVTPRGIIVNGSFAGMQRAWAEEERILPAQRDKNTPAPGFGPENT